MEPFASLTTVSTSNFSLQQLVQCLQQLGCQHAYLELVGTQNTPPHHLSKIFLLGHLF